MLMLGGFLVAAAVALAQQTVERAIKLRFGRVERNRRRLIDAQPTELAARLERLGLLDGHERVRVHVGDARLRRVTSSTEWTPPY